MSFKEESPPTARTRWVACLTDAGAGDATAPEAMTKETNTDETNFAKGNMANANVVGQGGWDREKNQGGLWTPGDHGIEPL